MDQQSLSTINKQQGITTLLVLVIVGLAITGAVLGSVGYVQNTQDRTTSFHTQTQAQMNAWSGVRALYQSLDQLRAQETPPTSAALYSAFNQAQANNSNLFSGTNDLEAYVVNLAGDSDRFETTIDVHGISLANADHVKSTSIVQMVLAFEDQPSTESEGLDSVISFNRGLTLGGSITVESPSNEAYQINIQGFFDTGGNSISGIDTIRATDSVRISSGSNFSNIFSNGDVRLEGSVSISESILARGNVCLSGGGTNSTGLTRAHGFVYGSGSAGFGAVEAHGSRLYEGDRSLCDDEAQNDLNGEPFAVILAGNNSADTVTAKGSVYNNGGDIDVRADGDYHNGYGRGEGTITGTARFCDKGPINCNSTVPNWKADAIVVGTDENLVIDIPDIPPVDVKVTGFDAYKFRANANYAYTADDDGFMRVTVRNVDGIASDDYYIGNYNGPYKQRLCTVLTNGSTPDNPTCAVPANAEESHRVCWGQSDYNDCFDYNDATNTWEIDGKSIAQGVAWFEGNLEVGNGTYYNTFIATGHFSTAGSHTSYAPNYAGYSGAVDGTEFAPKGMCENSVSENTPKQFCANGSYNANWASGLANYAYMAGSYDEDDNYVGGNIELGASTDAYGSVLAGNDFSSGGSSNVSGYITALAQQGTGLSSMGGSTTIKLNDLPPTYTAKAGDPGSPGGTGGGPFTVDVQWARYL